MNNKLLLKDRECGKCTACCVELTIEDPALTKLPGINCKHLKKNKGCNIYDDRPETCRKWFCMWRFMPLLGEEWRPDLKGILIKRSYNNIPIGYDGKIALTFEIIGKKSIVNDIEFIEVLSGYIIQGFPCFLSICKPKHVARKVFLNDKLKPLIESRNLPLMKEYLSSALHICLKQTTEKLMIDNGRVVER